MEHTVTSEIILIPIILALPFTRHKWSFHSRCRSDNMLYCYVNECQLLSDLQLRQVNRNVNLKNFLLLLYVINFTFLLPMWALLYRDTR